MAIRRPIAWPTVAAAALAAYAAASVSVGAGVVLARPHVVDDGTSYAVLAALSVVNTALVVTLVVRLPRHPVTVTLTAGLVLSMLGNGPGLLADAAGWDGLSTALANVGWLGGIPMLPLLFALFPDGWPTGRWRWVARADVAALALLVPVSAIVGGGNPVVAVTAAACGAVLFGTGVVGGVRLAVRALRRRDRQRGARPFAMLAGAIVLVFVVVPMSTAPFAFVVYGPSIAIGYGVLRHHLFGLDVAVRRIAIAAAASLVILGLYAVAATFLSSMLPAIVAALLLAPACRAALQLTNRRLYGDRRDPWLVMQQLGRDLAAASPDEVPALIARRTRAGLRLPWVGLDLDREGSLVPVAEDGVRQDQPVVAFELRHAGSRVGQLRVQSRRGQPDLDRRDRRALAQVAVDVSPSVSAARLVDELIESRERLVASRENERARLRRELHDGLSPSLAGMSLALGAARRQLGEIPDDAARLLTNVQDEASRTWRTVRSLLSDLRPPGLEELGLVGALEDRARQLHRPDDFTVELAVDVLPPLPAAVEVAAYRIATEAMTNAARHSAGHRCRVEVCANGQLDIVVTDDGRGIAAGPGIGMRSMTERAQDLGGWVHVEPAAGHGTVVHARLPLAVAP